MKVKYFLALLVFLFLPWDASAQTFSGARTHRQTNQNVLNNTQTAVGFTVENYDTDTYHDTVTNITRFTVAAAGYYRFRTNIYFAAAANGLRTIQIRRNGTDIVGYCSWEPESASTIQIKQCAGEWYEASAGPNYYEVYVYQNSGAALDVVADFSTGQATTWFAIHKMGN